MRSPDPLTTAEQLLDAPTFVEGDFRSLRRLLTQFAFLMTGSREQSDDLVAEAFARSWRALANGDRPGPSRLSEERTAHVLGISVGAAKSHAHRGLNRLRAILEEHRDE